jgi:hypothetical protein
MLGQIGAQQQALQQAQLQDAYSRWQQAQQYPLQMLALRQSAIPGSAGMNTTATTSGGASRSPFLSGLGGALTGAQLGSFVPGIGTGLGALGGGLLGLLG